NGFSVRNFINTSFGIQLETLEGFDPGSVNEVELIIDHDGFDSSWFKGNVSGIDVPSYPLWNLDGFTTGDWSKLMTYYDGQLVRARLPYNQTTQYYANIYFNMTASNAGFPSIAIENMTSITLDFAWNMTRTDATHELYVRNQTTGDWVLMTTATTRPGYGNDSIVHWDSALQGLTNLSHVIKDDGMNTVEFYIRPIDTSGALVTGNYDFAIDMILLNASYQDTFDNFTVQVYDWANAGFVGNGITIIPSSGSMIQTKLYLSAYFSNFQDLFDEEQKIINISIRANAITPLENTITWKVDRIKVNVTYTDIQRCSWNQTVFNATITGIFGTSQQTLFDSPSNNLTIDHSVLNITTDPGEYLFQLIWNNRSDFAINYSVFKLTPSPLAIVPVSGAYAENVSGDWFLESNNRPYPNDVSKSIVVLVRDLLFGSPVPGVTMTASWTTGPAPGITCKDKYAEHDNDPNFMGQYEIMLNTTGLNVTAGTPYQLVLNASKDNFVSDGILLNIDIIPLPVAILPSSFTPAVYENESAP
nr:hypothetical protein [Candidatus Sigynarchaeota archaeon]